MNYITLYTIFGRKTNIFKTHTTHLSSENGSIVINNEKNITITNSQNLEYANKSVYDYLFDKLGYRFILSAVKLCGYNVKHDEYLHFSIDINNVIFNNLLYERTINIILEIRRVERCYFRIYIKIA